MECSRTKPSPVLPLSESPGSFLHLVAEHRHDEGHLTRSAIPSYQGLQRVLDQSSQLTLEAKQKKKKKTTAMHPLSSPCVQPSISLLPLRKVDALRMDSVQNDPEPRPRPDTLGLTCGVPQRSGEVKRLASLCFCFFYPGHQR